MGSGARETKILGRRLKAPGALERATRAFSPFACAYFGWRPRDEVRSSILDSGPTEIVIQPLLEPAERDPSVFCRRPRRRHECRGRGRELYCFSGPSVYRRSRDSRKCDQHALFVGRNYCQRRRLSPKAEYPEAHSYSSGDYQFGRRALGGHSPHSYARADFLARDSLLLLGATLLFAF